MNLLKNYGYILAFGVFFALTILIRPVFPIDETRYLTVAWEMFLNKNYSLLTLNFEPYHHKPPMLFWLINMCWSIFGVSRWAAQIPIIAASFGVMVLTEKLAKKLYPTQAEINHHVPWLMLGSLPFLIYSTLIMFDVMLAATILACLMVFISYCEKPSTKLMVLGGLIIGCGVLIKGPVAYLYISWPLILFPYWKKETHQATTKQFYKALALSILVSGVPVLCWLVPALMQADQNFAYWIIWEQTAGRVQGNFSSSHVRPFYFYIMLAPILFMPWCFIPSFWRGLRAFSVKDTGAKFLISAVLPVFICFSVIAGKQPHYLLPLLPFLIIAIARFLKDKKTIKITALSMIALFILGQCALSNVILSKYNLAPMADFYSTKSDHDFAFVRKYQGEIGFLARIEKPMDSLQFADMDSWFSQNPDGLVIARYDDEDLSRFNMLFSIPYRGRNLGVFSKTNINESD